MAKFNICRRELIRIRCFLRKIWLNQSLCNYLRLISIFAPSIRAAQTKIMLHVQKTEKILEIYSLKEELLTVAVSLEFNIVSRSRQNLDARPCIERPRRAISVQSSAPKGRPAARGETGAEDVKRTSMRLVFSLRHFRGSVRGVVARIVSTGRSACSSTEYLGYAKGSSGSRPVAPYVRQRGCGPAPSLRFRPLDVVTTNVVQGEPGSSAFPLAGECAGRALLVKAATGEAGSYAGLDRPQPDPARMLRQKGMPHQGLPGMNNVESNDN